MPDPNQIKRIQEITVRFESLTEAGESVNISEFLEGVAPELQDHLLRDLLEIELSHKIRNNEEIDPTQYAQFGPEALDLAKSMMKPRELSTLGFTGDQSREHISDRYEIVRLIAQGGLGKVSIAIDHELNREVALKEVKEGLEKNSDALVRFALEAEVTGSLEHPGIVPVYGLGYRKNGKPYYAMRFVRGKSLRDACDEFHAKKESFSSSELALEFRNLLKRFVEVCNAIEYAHSRGIIHRDIKPDNVMLGKYGETLVVDWGLAKSIGRDGDYSVDEVTLVPRDSDEIETLAGSTVGTPAYMSPEQASGEIDELGPKSDIYSLGATLYYLLTNQPAFREQKLGTLLAKVISGDFKSPRQIDSSIAQPIDAVCLKAMSLNADSRYEHASALAEDVERWMADEPISVYQENVVQKIRRWSRKHSGTSLTIMISVISCLAMVLVFYQLVKSKNHDLSLAVAREQKEKDRAERYGESLNELNIEIKQKEEEARKERDAAIQVVDFLQNDLLAHASPDFEPDRNISLRTVVDRAAGSVNEKFKSNPLVGASVARMLGNTYVRLGEFVPATSLLESAYNKLVGECGKDDRLTLECVNDLSNLYLKKADFSRAHLFSEDNFRRASKLLPPDDKVLLDSMHNLANVLRVQGRFQEALDLNQKTLDRRIRTLTEKNRDTLISMNAVALNYRNLARFKKAESKYQNVLRLRTEHLGDKHPDTLGTRIQYSRLLLETQDFDEAERLIQETHNNLTEIFDLDHPYVLDCELAQAEWLNAKGKVDESLEKVQAIVDKRLNSQDVILQHVNGNKLRIARIYRIKRDFKTAEKILNQILASYESRDRSFVYRTEFRAMRELATAYRQMKRFDESLVLLKQLSDVQQQKLGENHPEIFRNYFAMAQTHRAAGALAEAKANCELALSKQKKLIGDEHPVTLASQQLLGWILYDLGSPTECEKLLNDVEKKRLAVFGNHHSLYHQILFDLGQFHHLEGNDQRAIDAYVELLTLQRRYLPPGNRPLTRTLALLANEFEIAGQAERAEPIRQELVAALDKLDEPWKKKSHAYLLLANNLLMLKKYSECKAFCKERLSNQSNESIDLALARFCQGISMVATDEVPEGEKIAEKSYQYLEQNAKRLSKNQTRMTETYCKQIVTRFRDLDISEQANHWNNRIEKWVR